ncbi:hypothetical protein [Bdellovibrio sp. HCB-110]|uniref:hypothetical protein n=1 Tax=Bdellovibrio sp. HCB-110 TaxID=3391182 RepID=UPI0039B6918C
MKLTKVLVPVLFMAFSIQSHAQVESEESPQIKIYKACVQVVKAFVKKRVAAGRSDFTYPFTNPICVSDGEGKLDLIVTLAMLDRGATNQSSIEAGEAVESGKLDRASVLRLLRNSLITGPTANRLAFEISPLIASGKLDEDCYVLNQLIMPTSDAIEKCTAK